MDIFICVLSKNLTSTLLFAIYPTPIDCMFKLIDLKRIILPMFLYRGFEFVQMNDDLMTIIVNHLLGFHSR